MSRARRLTVPPRTDTETLVEAWGTRIDAPLLQLVLVHRSYASEAGDTVNNERFESLGDSVPSIITVQKFYEQYPNAAESDLSRMRTAIVPQQSLVATTRRIGLSNSVFLGKGESMHGGCDKDSILSNTFEALIGATYSASGLEEAHRAILKRLSFPPVDAPSRGQYQDWKTTLIEYPQAQGLGEISYEVEGEGPGRQRVFTARAFTSKRPDLIGSGQTSSEKYTGNVAVQDTVSRLSSEK